MFTRLCILFLFFRPLAAGEDEITDPSDKLTDPEETTKPPEIDASRFFTDTLITGQVNNIQCKTLTNILSQKTLITFFLTFKKTL